MRILDKEVFAVSPVRFKKNGKIGEGSASGFFYKHQDKLYFITNRHVVIDEEAGFSPDELDLNLHIDPNNLIKTDKFSIPLMEGKRKLWLEHQPVDGEEVDVVAVPVKEDISRFHIAPFNINDLLPTGRYVSIGDDLLVVGYPLGIRDTMHKTPVIRSAIMASIYPLPFDGKPYFLIDSFLHGGTSGSPVLLKPSSTVRFIDGHVAPNLDKWGSYKRYLLGIHSGSFIPSNWKPCKVEIEDNGICPRLGLNKVWFASLILEIIGAL